MKKTFFLFIIFLISVSVSGCFGSEKTEELDKEFTPYVEKVEKIINVLNKNQNLLDKGVNKKQMEVKVQDGYSLFSSILSHSGDMVVYTEVKGGMEDMYKGWEYHVVYRNLKTNEHRTIYSFPEKSPLKTSLKNLFIKKAQALGCKAIPFPLAWTKNDRKVILEGIEPVGCTEGGSFGLGLFQADPRIGELESLRYISFFNEYSRGITLKSGDKKICNSMNVFTNEKVIAHDIEYNKDEDMTFDTNYHYRFLGVNEVLGVLNLERVSLKYNKGCYEFVGRGESIEVSLANF